MRGQARNSGQRGWQGRAVAVAALALLTAAAIAEVANITLRDGTRLRGDVSTTDTEIVVSNPAGETRYPKSAIAAVEWAVPSATLDEEFLRRFRLLPANDIEGHFGLAEWAMAEERFDLVKKQCSYILGLRPDHANAKLLRELASRKLTEAENGGEPSGDAVGEEREGLPPPPVLSELDIRRVKLLEYPLDNPPEKLQVRFINRRGEPDLITLVKRELNAAGVDDDGIRDGLTRGKLPEQLAAIVEATGAKYAARVEINGDLPSFTTFRRKVLPLVTRGCATSGCHGGNVAVAMRLPRGSTTTDEYVYTSFVLLDRVQTRFGPLIDRRNPEESALLGFLMTDGRPRPDARRNDEREANPRPHPPVPSGRLAQRLKSTDDPNYQVILDWISSLRSPHPVYELDYTFPAWLPPASQPTSQPAATQPAEPAEPDRG